MKILLVAMNAKYVHSALAVYDLETYAKKYAGVDLALSVKELTINHNMDTILQELYKEKADVYAFSCYIWNISEVLQTAKELKKVLPPARIWLGGPEVGYDAAGYLKKNSFVEGIMTGEGELTFCALAEQWTKEPENRDYRKIKGITYRGENGEWIITAPQEYFHLDDLPFIYENLSRFENKILYYETSRGCPFSCSYCLSSIDKKVRFRSMELVKKELAFFLEHKVRQVKFVDRTFNCDRKRARLIWTYLTEHDNGLTNFHFEIAADLIGEEELAIFEKMRPGLIQLEIGLQSVNPETIHEIRRTMDVDQVKKRMLKIHSFHNIHQHLDLIAGLPYEDYASFCHSFDEAYEMLPDQLQLGFLKVLKGSYMAETVKEYELQYRESEPYEVLSTKWLSYDEILILKKVEEMVELYYNSSQFTLVLAYVVSLYNRPYDFYHELGEYYEKEGLLGLGLKREKKYTVLRDFFRERFSLSDFSPELFDDLLTLDYYLRENVRNRPDWSKKQKIEKELYQSFFINGGNGDVSITYEGYDSKAAEHGMHIEAIRGDTYQWLEKNGLVRAEGKGKQEVKERVYVLFDYGNRDPLSNDATVYYLMNL